MKRKVLQIEPNEPVEVTLTYDDGTDISRPGRTPQIMYSLADGRVMFVPPEARNVILSAGIRRNEPFLLLKRMNGTGVVEWKVGRTAEQDDLFGQDYRDSVVADRMRDAMVEAVDAAYAAQQHANKIGFTAMPQFTGEDLRTMANTAVIEAGRERG